MPYIKGLTVADYEYFVHDKWPWQHLFEGGQQEFIGQVAHCETKF